MFHSNIDENSTNKSTYLVLAFSQSHTRCQYSPHKQLNVSGQRVPEATFLAHSQPLAFLVQAIEKLLGSPTA